MQNSNDAINGVVMGTLQYLDSRIEFWRQQKPIYSRQDKQSKEAKEAKLKNTPRDVETKLIRASLRNIKRGIFPVPTKTRDVMY